MTKQTRKSIINAIKQMQKKQNIFYKSGDLITSRMLYAMSELLRWSIEDTVDWDKPSEQAISNAEILKNELKQQPQKTGDEK